MSDSGGLQSGTDSGTGVTDSGTGNRAIRPGGWLEGWVTGSNNDARQGFHGTGGVDQLEVRPAPLKSSAQ
jgi:hypothetical protein